MSELYENSQVTRGSSFSQMEAFLMSANPGQFAMILGGSGELQLALPEFMRTLREGLIEYDFLRVRHFYHEVTSQLKATALKIIYDRFGWPYVLLRGEIFPNTKTFVELGFLKDRKIVPSGEIHSDDFVLEWWLKDDLEKLVANSGGAIELRDRMYTPPKSESEIPTELQRLVTDVAIRIAAEGNIVRIYSGGPRTPEEERLIKLLRRFYYRAELDIGDRNLSQIAEMIGTYAEMVQENYLKAKTFIQSRENPGRH